MIDATRENRIDQLARAAEKAGVPLTKKVIDARTKITRIGKGRIEAENAFNAAKAQLTADLLDAAGESVEAVTDTICNSDAVRLESIRRLHEIDVMAQASQQAAVQALAAVRDTAPEWFAELAEEYAERGKDLARVAGKLPVDDLRNAEQVVRLGGSAAADAAVGLETLAKLQALQHAVRALEKCGWGSIDAPEMARNNVDLMRDIRIESLDELNKFNEVLKWAGNASPLWVAVRNGYTLEMGEPANVENAAREIGLEQQAEADRHNPYRRVSLA